MTLLQQFMHAVATSSSKHCSINIRTTIHSNLNKKNATRLYCQTYLKSGTLFVNETLLRALSQIIMMKLLCNYNAIIYDRWRFCCWSVSFIIYWYSIMQLSLFDAVEAVINTYKWISLILVIYTSTYIFLSRRIERRRP